MILKKEEFNNMRQKVQKRKSYDRLIELGASPSMVHKLGFVYPFQKENGHKPEALICTNSDRIAQCHKLVEALPQMHFHIAALTEMSSKLMSMGTYENVSLYPGIKTNILDELFEKCDFYLDINHESDIVSAVRRAFLHNQLILAFEETIHNRDYIAEQHIYRSNQADQMIMDLKEFLAAPKRMEGQLIMQHAWACAENAEKYQENFA